MESRVTFMEKQLKRFKAIIPEICDLRDAASVLGTDISPQPYMRNLNEKYGEINHL
jgi:hypothetical protein